MHPATGAAGGRAGQGRPVAPPGRAARGDGPLDLGRLRALEAAILAAHGRGDDAALARLYAEGAEAVLGTNEDAGAFLLTQAYVFALRAGDEAAARRCHARLVALGREA